jgi:CheY-like chemotaxis protein
LHQSKLCFCILVFAALDKFLKLDPEELDLRFTTPFVNSGLNHAPLQAKPMPISRSGSWGNKFCANLSVRRLVTRDRQRPEDTVNGRENTDSRGQLPFCRNLGYLTEEAGYETSLAKNSGQGIRKAFTDRPDLILTDLNLPDMTAIEAIRILKKIPLTSGIPIVVLTAETARQLKTKALKAGAAEYILKPVPITRLTPSSA